MKRVSLSFRSTAQQSKLSSSLSELKSSYRSVRAKVQRRSLDFYYRCMIRLQPTQAAVYQTGLLLASPKNWQEAITCYRQAIAQNLDIPVQVYQDLGIVLVRLKRFAEAVEAYEQLIQLKPNTYVAYKQLAGAALKLSQWETVITASRQAIRLNPKAFWPYYYLAQALSRQQQWQEAIAAYRQAIVLDPHYYWAYEFLSDVLLNQGQIEDCITLWQQGIEHNPHASGFHRGLGDALTQQGQISEALGIYQTASQLLIQKSHPHFQQPNAATPASPHFIILGITKGGTTSLYDYLTQHPQILPALRKEVRFWHDNPTFERSLSWYLAQFPAIALDQPYITGEATPAYIRVPIAGERLAQVFPQTKLILLLRNPIDRAISHYYMNVREGKEHRSIEAAFFSELEFISTHSEADWMVEQTHFSYLRRWIYLTMIERWMQFFPKEQFLILKSEDFFTDPSSTVNQVFQFLEVAPYTLPAYSTRNEGYYTPISSSLRSALGDFFQPHNQKLEAFLGQKFDW